MRYVKKFILVTIIVFIIFNTFAVNINTVYGIEGSWAELQEKVRSFIDKGKEGANFSGGGDTDDIFSNLRFLGRVLTTIGAGILVVLALIMGIKYITATPETMGKIKTQAIGLVVAAFVIFGAYAIWSVVLNVVSTF